MYSCTDDVTYDSYKKQTSIYNLSFGKRTRRRTLNDFWQSNDELTLVTLDRWWAPT